MSTNPSWSDVLCKRCACPSAENAQKYTQAYSFVKNVIAVRICGSLRGRKVQYVNVYTVPLTAIQLYSVNTFDDNLNTAAFNCL